jgi:hypothetical protein
MPEDKPPSTQHLKPELFENASTVYSPKLELYNRLPADHLTHSLVGRVAADWAYVEHLLDVILWELGLDASLIAKIWKSDSKMEKILDLCTNKQMNKGILDEITKLRDQVKDLQNRRNRIVHDPWYIEDRTKIPQQYKLQSGFHPANEADLKKTLEEIDRSIKTVTKLRESINAAMQQP